MSAPPIVADGLDADAIAAILLARQRALSRPPAVARAQETLLAFDLGGVTHGLPIDRVRSVAPLPKVTRLPHAPAALLGLVAWRGTVVNLFALAAVLGREPKASTAMIVLRHDAPRIALAVDALAGVVTVPQDDAPPALTRLVAQGDGRLTRIDPASLIETLLPSRLQEG
ncbi:chemotaxis protein CheW [Sphingomonas sp. 2R-10]|uniref:chemotaxis protein CheW n=1 Tax=Sphingomonas sp. 2R-10 TaxID=3045148 RepID=UPI000F797A88|nr:chemotaxis protein CheW [Sphingomonas sp. 2R-10]MDJ0278955.1 chemotaxis protein CheW [Sphingomonas sp. 2R-10]